MNYNLTSSRQKEKEVHTYLAQCTLVFNFYWMPWIIYLFFTGFPYLISKYAKDFGLVDEQCFPYEGRDVPCHKQACPRHFGTGYHYVGGFYGGCNEVLMRLELLKNGPIAVSFEVYNDFKYYRGGIYHHTGEPLIDCDWSDLLWKS